MNSTNIIKMRQSFAEGVFTEQERRTEKNGAWERPCCLLHVRKGEIGNILGEIRSSPRYSFVNQVVVVLILVLENMLFFFHRNIISKIVFKVLRFTINICRIKLLCLEEVLHTLYKSLSYKPHQHNKLLYSKFSLCTMKICSMYSE